MGHRMIYSEKVRRAMVLAHLAHANQYDKGGYPYINHLITVASGVNTEDETIVALLHDLIEDEMVPDLSKEWAMLGFDSKEKAQYFQSLIENAYKNNQSTESIATLICDTLGFSSDVRDALVIIAKPENETYSDYIKNVAVNEIARHVKLSDLKHNMTTDRLPKEEVGTQKYNKLQERYRKAKEYLMEVQK